MSWIYQRPAHTHTHTQTHKVSRNMTASVDVDVARGSTIACVVDMSASCTHIHTHTDTHTHTHTHTWRYPSLAHMNSTRAPCMYQETSTRGSKPRRADEDMDQNRVPPCVWVCVCVSYRLVIVWQRSGSEEPQPPACPCRVCVIPFLASRVCCVGGHRARLGRGRGEKGLT